MSVSNTQVTCPKCRSVLRPAKPLPAGKQVKCPKCGTTFTTPGAEPETIGLVEDDPPKKTAPAKAGPDRPAGKKGKPDRPGGPKGKPAKPPKPAAPARKTEEEEEGGTYGFVREESKEEEDKPDISYAPDMSIKDLRGPAQSAIMGPSNRLMFCGAAGFLGWLLATVILLIPVLFPVQETNPEGEDKDKAQSTASASDKSGEEGAKKKKGEAPNHSFFDVGDIPLSKVADLPWYLVILALPIPGALFAVYSATIAFGAVKMQELESRPWGIAACVMALLPINTGGLALVLVLFEQMLLGMVFDFDWFLYAILGVSAGLLWLIQAGIGLTGLTTLMKPEVIAGFEFVPD
jgi:hypothetical protein